MSVSIKLPFYTKISSILIGLCLFVYVLYSTKSIVLPIIYSGVISILLSPIVEFLVKKKIKRILAITIAIVLAILFTGGIVFLLTNQFSMFTDAFPKMEVKINELIKQIEHWASVNFKINPAKINEGINKIKTDINNHSNELIGQTLVTITGLLIVVFLIPVYVFMMLYYQPLLLEFLRKLFTKIHQQKLEEVLLQTKTIIQSYLTGLLIEAIIVATLNVTALLIIGIDYAILLGITGALLNIIPFIGGIISVALPMFIALVTKDSYVYILFVLLSYMCIQFFDNHFITPKIVASKVKVNALIAVIVVICGGALWGIPGMFLSIPLTGIVKVIFEHIDPLKPWAFLLGDTMPISSRRLFNFSKKKTKK